MSSSVSASARESRALRPKLTYPFLCQFDCDDGLALHSSLPALRKGWWSSVSGITSLRYEVELIANRAPSKEQQWKVCTGELEMVGAFTKFSCSRSSNRARHHLFLEERIGGNRISPAAILNGGPPMEAFEAVEQPSEPTDDDQPPRCPPPERCITQDGMKWKEMVARRREKKAWQSGDVGMMMTPQPRRRIHNSPRAKYLFMNPSLPEQQRLQVTRLLE